MISNDTAYINWTLIEKFQLSDKALVTYAAILKGYRFTRNQSLNPLSLTKILFGAKAEKAQIIRQGLKELVDKEVISLSCQDKGLKLYDLTPLANYERLHFVADDFSFFEKYEDLNSEVCSLYRLYLHIKTCISQSKKEGNGCVLKTYKNSLATSTNCCRQVIGKRLEDLKDHELIIYKDYSDFTYFSINGKVALFIALPEFEDELSQVVKNTIPSWYLRHKYGKENSNEPTESCVY